MSRELKFDQADADRVNEIERSVGRHLNQFRENTEATLVCFALAKCIRRLLSNYPATTRKVLREIMADFVEEKKETRHVENTGAFRLFRI